MGPKSRSSIDRAKSRLGRLHGAVSDPSSDGVISWSESGKSFIVWKPEELLTDVLPKWGIALSSFPSFTDVFLKGYGFRKVDSGSEERWEFEEEDFVRGQLERIGAMYRRTKEREDNSERGKERMKKVEERMRARREKARMMKDENNVEGTCGSA